MPVAIPFEMLDFLAGGVYLLGQAGPLDNHVQTIIASRKTPWQAKIPFAAVEIEVSSRATQVPVDSENTSNTSLPPQLLESGSSFTERIPHSARPVIGSTGMRRRNRK